MIRRIGTIMLVIGCTLILGSCVPSVALVIMHSPADLAAMSDAQLVGAAIGSAVALFGRGLALVIVGAVLRLIGTRKIRS